MIKQLMILDGVMAVAQFRDDGVLVEGMGMQDESQLAGLAMFAHDYKRIVQGNADQLSMFTQVSGWTPPTGWLVRGAQVTVCSVGNIVCLVDSNTSSINEVMRELQDASHW
jgi:roadblock/LC7 domain-containing protein